MCSECDTDYEAYEEIMSLKDDLRYAKQDLKDMTDQKDDWEQRFHEVNRERIKLAEEMAALKLNLKD